MDPIANQNSNPNPNPAQPKPGTVPSGLPVNQPGVPLNAMPINSSPIMPSSPITPQRPAAAQNPVQPFNPDELNFKTMPQGYKAPDMPSITKPKPAPAPMSAPTTGSPSSLANAAASAINTGAGRPITPAAASQPVPMPSTMGNFGGPAQPAAHKTLSKNTLMIIIAIVVILILGIGAFWYFGMGSKPVPAPALPPALKAIPNQASNSQSAAQPDQTQATPPDQTQTAQTASQIPADWLQKYFGVSSCVNQDVCGDSADPDHDGLSNLQEYQAGTDPNNAASDGDGIADGDAVHVFNLNPLNDHTAGNPKFTDAGDLKYKYNSKANRNFTDCDLVQIAANIKQYGLHEPTITTLGSDLVSFYTNYQTTSTTDQCLNQ